MDKSQGQECRGASDGARPRTRQRLYKAPPSLDVPNIEEDAAERKRVLNVLAQRRYRERKRHERLKGKAQGETPASEESGDKSPETHSEDFSFPSDAEVPSLPIRSNATVAPQPQPSANGEVGVSLADLELLPWDSLDDTDATALIENPSGSLDTFTGQTICKGADGLAQAAFAGLGGPSPPAFSSAFGSPSSLEALSSSSESDFDFVDNYLLPVHELTLLKAFQRIAQRLGCENSDLWTLDCLSPFNQGLGTPSDQLPAAWRPTMAQVTIPHHPLLDFMPWPGVRDRILMTFNLPESARPPNARGPLALVNFAYDFEDNSEGVRIYGSDPYDPASWEVGQVLFERWWFLFDRSIIETSNRWREIRGAPQLMLKGC